MDLRLLHYFVVVVEERHIGRAAERLRITQPPLSRALRQLEGDLGATLLDRTPRGVTPTPAGTVLFEEARTLFEQVERVRERVRAEAGNATLVIGTLADTAVLAGSRLVDAFRREHPHVTVAVHESDLGDPTAGLRAGLVDAALTRTPFDGNGLRTLDLGSDPVGVVVRADDPLAGRDAVAVDELTDRHWIRLPDGTDPIWAAYWTGPFRPDAPVMRTIQECVRSVLWDGTSALAPIAQPLPPTLTVVPAADRPPSHLVLAWRDARPTPPIRSLTRIAKTLK